MSIIIIIFATVLSLFFPKSVEAYNIAGQSGALRVVSEKNIDQRKDKLRSFLRAQNSPLAEHSDRFVEFADKYGIDWKLLPAISGVESAFGKRIIASSFEKVSKALAEKYYARGLNTPQKMNPVYCPPNKDWAGKVTSVMNKIENIRPRISYNLIELSL